MVITCSIYVHCEGMRGGGGVTCRTSERVRERGTARQAGARLNPYRQRTTEAFSRWKALHLHTASRQSCEEKW